MGDRKKQEMDIKRSLEILDLGDDISEEELKRAYKDAIHVWHPDRFLHNPRLMAKAEAKTKEINAAYATLRSRLYSETSSRYDYKAGKSETGTEEKAEETSNKVEAVAEIGTIVILNIWSCLSGIIGRLTDNDNVNSSQQKDKRQVEK